MQFTHRWGWWWTPQLRIRPALWFKHRWMSQMIIDDRLCFNPDPVLMVAAYLPTYDHSHLQPCDRNIVIECHWYKTTSLTSFAINLPTIPAPSLFILSLRLRRTLCLTQSPSILSNFNVTSKTAFHYTLVKWSLLSHSSLYCTLLRLWPQPHSRSREILLPRTLFLLSATTIRATLIVSIVRGYVIWRGWTKCFGTYSDAGNCDSATIKDGKPVLIPCSCPPPDDIVQAVSQLCFYWRGNKLNTGCFF